MPYTLKKAGGEIVVTTGGESQPVARLKPPTPDQTDRLTQVNLQLTQEQNWRLAKMALAQGISKSAMARQALRAYFDQQDFKSGDKKREWEK